jgi:hypothetical protein
VTIALVVGALALATALQQTAPPPSAAAFDGALRGATIEDGGTFRVENGVLRAEGPNGWLRLPQPARDFRIRAELRFVTSNGDSGIFLRARPDRAFARGWPNRSYQVQLLNPLSGSPIPPLGGVFRHGMPPGDTAFDQEAVRKAFTGTGEWQRLEVEVVGTDLTVRLNGTVVTRASDIADVEGYIGIQSETGAVEFRRVDVERLDR